MLWLKALLGAALLALGFYVGRETGRTEVIRRDLEGRPPPRPGGGEGPGASAGPGESPGPGESGRS